MEHFGDVLEVLHTRFQGGNFLFKAIDHIAIAVWSIDNSLPYYTEQLGMSIVSSETVEDAGVKMTYLDAGNIMIQLLEPIRDCPVKQHLEERGEGLHHFCLAVEDTASVLHEIPNQANARVVLGGRNRRTAFLQNVPNQLIIELTDIEEVMDDEKS